MEVISIEQSLAEVPNKPQADQKSAPKQQTTKEEISKDIAKEEYARRRTKRNIIKGPTSQKYRKDSHGRWRLVLH